LTALNGSAWVARASGLIARRPLDLLWAGIAFVLAIEAMTAPDLWIEGGWLLYAMIQLLSGVLFVLRREVQLRPRRVLPTVVAAVSVVGVYLYRAEHSAWSSPRVGAVLAAMGSLIALLAMLSLGRSFGVLPACRGVKSGGLFQWVRHPLYAGYLVLDAGFLATFPSLWNACWFVALAALLLCRIRCEEALLLQTTAYRSYARRVRSRLLPGLY
jgi:protein-S-isoprenylcysteine O-methyltransferase Ste14